MDSDVPVFHLKIRIYVLYVDIEMYNERTFNYGTHSYVIKSFDYVPYQVAIIMFRIIVMICWEDSLLCKYGI